MPSLDTLLEQAAQFLREHEHLLIVSHADADGICATTILDEALDATKIAHEIIFLNQVSAIALAKIAKETEGAVVFVDLGASHLGPIGEGFANRPVLIIDHHQPHGDAPHAVHCNPVAAGLDGTRVVSAAGLALEIATLLAPDTAARLSPIAIIGAQADNQEQGAFVGINRRILDDAIAADLVRAREGARLHGIETKNVLDLVAYSYDLRIDGVTRNREGARRFLRQIGLRDVERLRYAELEPDEQDLLDRELIRRSPNPQARVTHYTILDAPNGPLRDTREASTLLNACGRSGKAPVAVRTLRGDETALRTALDAQRQYRKAVQEAHRWFQDARAQGDEDVIIKSELVLIRARDRVPPDIAGTLCSVLTKGEEVPRGTVVICVAHNRDGTGTSKVSSRAVESHADLATIMREAAAAVGGEGGGHVVAAGAIIPTDAEEEFLQRLQDSLV